LGHTILALLALGLAGTAPAQHQPPQQQYRTDRGSLLEADAIVSNCLPTPSERRSRRPIPPQRVRIGKVIYTVEVVKEVPAAGEFASFSGTTCDTTARKLGVCDAKDHIYLEAGQTLKEEQTTLLHELQHAIFRTENIYRKTTYHQLIYQLSPKLLEVLQENPDLYFYLTASESK
jgi:hypothetical protein